MRQMLKGSFHSIVLLLLGSWWGGFTWGQGGDRVLTLKNGMQFEGTYFTIDEYTEKIDKLVGARTSIVMLNDDLRRIFFSRKNVVGNVEFAKTNLSMDVYQHFSSGQSARLRIANLVRVGSFDEYGIRRVTVRNNKGVRHLFHGITEVAPKYCVVQDLNDRDWESRIATSTVPTEILIPLLRRQAPDRNSIAHRMEIVALLIEAGRYWDANGELKMIGEAFPDMAVEIREKRDLLVQQFARQVLTEVKLQRRIGQQRLAKIWLDKIKSSDVAGEILAEVLDVEEQIKNEAAVVERIRGEIKKLANALTQEQDIQPATAGIVAKIAEEIIEELDHHTIQRMATFDRFLLDAAQTNQQKMSYAISGWLIGTAKATPNLAISTSLVQVRNLVREYLTTAGDVRRRQILRELMKLEGSQPDLLAKLIEHLDPLNPPEFETYDPSKPFEFEVTISDPSAESGKRVVTYLAQLPPEYDPHRRYPCMVGLHSESQDPIDQIRLWCGPYNPRLKIRNGQAGRHGYIVIAPKWNRTNRRLYGYSGVEHAAVLTSLRDALRRFSIDTDRVFLSGLFAGGDAAWDIGLSHPSHWAGVIPISAFSGPKGQYSFRCYENAAFETLPFYFVCGQYDVGRIEQNKLVFNKWLGGTGYDVTLVEYRGRMGRSLSRRDADNHRVDGFAPTEFHSDQLQGANLAALEQLLLVDGNVRYSAGSNGASRKLAAAHWKGKNRGGRMSSAPRRERIVL